MRILVVVPNLHGGGAERVVSLLTSEWAINHNVSTVLFDTSGIAYTYGGSIFNLDSPASSRFTRKCINIALRSKRLVEIFRRERPDRIFAFMESANVPCIAAAALSSCLDKLWISVHNNTTHMSFVFRAVMPYLYRLPNRIVTVSEGVQRELESMRLPSARISTIHNPIEQQSRAVRMPLSTPPLRGRFILAAGRLVEQKGFDRLLTAFSRVDQVDLQLVILGEGVERNNLMRQASELGIGSRVHLPGWVSDIDVWYQHAECFALSSRYEGLGNVLLEAMANGCPVVAFDCPHGPSELIVNGVDGILVPDGDIDALSDAISCMVSDGCLRRELAANSLQSAGRFSVEKIAPRWLAP